MARLIIDAFKVFRGGLREARIQARAETFCSIFQDVLAIGVNAFILFIVVATVDQVFEIFNTRET
jgi:hypothetical protein